MENSELLLRSRGTTHLCCSWGPSMGIQALPCILWGLYPLAWMELH